MTVADVIEPISVRGHQILQRDIQSRGKYPVVSQSDNAVEGYTNAEIAITDVPLVLFGDHTCCLKYIQEPFVVGADGVRLLKSRDGDSEFLYYYLTTLIPSVEDGRYRRHYVSLTDLEINMPPKEVRGKIGCVLSTIDRKIALNRKRIATLEAMAKEIYDYWFVQFDFPDAHGHPYKSSGGAMVYNPDLKREIPKGWGVGDFTDLIDFTMGQSPAGSTLNESGDGVLFFQGATDFGSFFPSPRQFTDSPVRMAKAGDVLLSVRAPVGTLNFASEDCCIGRGLGAFRGKIVGNLFVWFYLKSLRPYFDSKNVAGTTFGSIGKDDFKMLKSVIPSTSILRVYSDVSDGIFEQMKLCERAMFNDQKIRDFLLPLLMNGQVKIGGAE